MLASASACDLARPSDDAELREMLRTPMGGSIEVAFLREPNYFIASRIQGTRVQVMTVRRDGRIAAVGTRALRPTFVNGERVEAGYLSDLRIRPEFRGSTVLARGYRYLRELHADGEARIYSSVIVEDNRAALDTIAANRPGMPAYTDCGRILTPIVHLRRPLPPIEAEIERATLADLPEIVAKLNENRMQFAPAYETSDFLDGRFRDFRVTDFRLLRRRGRIAGVLGTWDQRGFRQTVVARYRGILGAVRPLVNLVRRPPLPPPGDTLRFFYAAFASTDDPEAYAALLRRIHNDSIGRGYTHFVTGLHERDPRAAAFEEYERTPFAGRLFAVTFDGPAELDGRVPYMEAALL